MATCDTVAQLLQTISGQLNKNIYKETIVSNIWLNRVKQEAWEWGVGSTLSVEVQDATFPSLGLTWTPISQSTDSGPNQSCGLTGNDVEFGNSLRSYTLEQAAANTPTFCLKKMLLSWQFKQQMDNIYNLLKEMTVYFWTFRYRSEYSRVAGNHVVLDGVGSIGTTTGYNQAFPNIAPTYALTQGVLRKIYQKIIVAGGGNSAAGRESGRPVFILVTSPETSENIIKSSAEIRQDYRFSSKVDELLAPLGVDKSYGGFYHYCDDLPRRFDFVGGQWIEYEPNLPISAATGNVRTPNPYWENAAYEESYVLHDEVMKSLVASPDFAPGGNTRFDSISYRGDFAFRRPGIDRVCNPDGDLGWYRAVFTQATMPIKPQFGYAIRHLRCIDNDLRGCSVSYC